MQDNSLLALNEACLALVNGSADLEISKEVDLIVSCQITVQSSIDNSQKLAIQTFATLLKTLALFAKSNLHSKSINPLKTGLDIANVIVNDNLPLLFKIIANFDIPLIQHTLRLLGEMFFFLPLNSCRNILQKFFEFQLVKNGQRLYRIRRKSDHSSKIEVVEESEDNLPKKNSFPEDVRFLYAKFILQFLKNGDQNLKKSVLEQKDLFTGLFKGLDEDHYLMVKEVLNCLKENVIDDSTLSRTLKVSFFNNFVLELISKLYDRNDPKDPSCRSPFTKDQSSSTIADLAHNFFIHIATKPGIGICFQDGGWYLPYNRNNSSNNNTGLAAKHIRVYNTVLLRLLEKLRWENCSMRRELIFECLKTCPELVHPLLLSTNLNIDPQNPSFTSNLSFISKIVNIPPPTLFSIGQNSKYSQKKFLKGSLPPPLQITLENILPTGLLTKQFFSKSLLNKNSQIKGVVVFVLNYCFEKLSLVEKEMKECLKISVGAGGKNEEADEDALFCKQEWKVWWDDVVEGVWKRVPDIQLVLSLLQTKVSVVHVNDVDNNSDGGAAFDNEVLQDPEIFSSILKLLFNYQTCFPDCFRESKFDIGKLMVFLNSPDDFLGEDGEWDQVSLNLIKVLDYFKEFKWWNYYNKEKVDLTHFGQILLLSQKTKFIILSNACLKFLNSLLLSTFLFENAILEVNCWLSSIQNFVSLIPSTDQKYSEIFSLVWWFDQKLSQVYKDPQPALLLREHLEKKLSSNAFNDDSAFTDYINSIQLLRNGNEDLVTDLGMIRKPFLSLFLISVVGDFSIKEISDRPFDVLFVENFLGFCLTDIFYYTQFNGCLLMELFQIVKTNVGEDIDDEDGIYSQLDVLVADQRLDKENKFIQSFALLFSRYTEFGDRFLPSIPQNKPNDFGCDKFIGNENKFSVYNFNKLFLATISDLCADFSISNTLDSVRSFMLTRHPQFGSIFYVYDDIKSLWSPFTDEKPFLDLHNSTVYSFLKSLDLSFLVKNYIFGWIFKRDDSLRIYGNPLIEKLIFEKVNSDLVGGDYVKTARCILMDLNAMISQVGKSDDFHDKTLVALVQTLFKFVSWMFKNLGIQITKFEVEDPKQMSLLVAIYVELRESLFQHPVMLIVFASRSNLHSNLMDSCNLEFTQLISNIIQQEKLVHFIPKSPCWVPFKTFAQDLILQDLNVSNTDHFFKNLPLFSTFRSLLSFEEVQSIFGHCQEVILNFSKKNGNVIIASPHQFVPIFRLLCEISIGEIIKENDLYVGLEFLRVLIDLWILFDQKRKFVDISCLLDEFFLRILKSFVIDQKIVVGLSSIKKKENHNLVVNVVSVFSDPEHRFIPALLTSQTDSRDRFESIVEIVCLLVESDFSIRKFVCEFIANEKKGFHFDPGFGILQLLRAIYSSFITKDNFVIGVLDKIDEKSIDVMLDVISPLIDEYHANIFKLNRLGKRELSIPIIISQTCIVFPKSKFKPNFTTFVCSTYDASLNLKPDDDIEHHIKAFNFNYSCFAQALSNHKSKSLRSKTVLTGLQLCRLLFVKKKAALDVDVSRESGLDNLFEFLKSLLALNADEKFETEFIENIFKSEIEKTVVKKFFVATLKYRYLDPRVYDLLEVVFRMSLQGERTILFQPEKLADMIFSHSQFEKATTFSPFDHPVKSSLMKFVRFVFKLDAIRNFTPSNLQKLSLIYNKSTSHADKTIISIFRDFELSLGASATSYLINYSSQLLTPGTFVGSYLEVFSNINAELMIKSVENFNPIEPLKFRGYDPDYIVPLIAHCIEQDEEVNKLDVRQIISSNSLGLCIMTLCAEDPEMRRRGFFSLDMIFSKLKNSEFKEKSQINLMMDTFKNSITDRSTPQRIPCMMALFVAQSLEILLKPESFMFVHINRFLLQRPVLHLEDVPLFYNTFYSNSDDHRKERRWILRLIKHGLKTNLDYKLCQRRHVFDVLFGYFQAPISDVFARKLILEIFESFAKVPSAVADMISHDGLLTFLNICLGNLIVDPENILFIGFIRFINLLFQGWANADLNWHGRAGKQVWLESFLLLSFGLIDKLETFLIKCNYQLAKVHLPWAVHVFDEVTVFIELVVTSFETINENTATSNSTFSIRHMNALVNVHKFIDTQMVVDSCNDSNTEETLSIESDIFHLNSQNLNCLFKKSAQRTYTLIVRSHSALDGRIFSGTGSTYTKDFFVLLDWIQKSISSPFFTASRDQISQWLCWLMKMEIESCGIIEKIMEEFGGENGWNRLVQQVLLSSKTHCLLSCLNLVLFSKSKKFISSKLEGSQMYDEVLDLLPSPSDFLSNRQCETSLSYKQTIKLQTLETFLHTKVFGRDQKRIENNPKGLKVLEDCSTKKRKRK